MRLPRPIGFAPVGHPYHEDDQLIVQHFVQHPVATNSDSPEAAQSALQHASGQWLFRQPIDGANDAHPIIGGNPPEFPGGAALNPYGVVHAGRRPSPVRDRRGHEAAPPRL